MSNAVVYFYGTCILDMLSPHTGLNAVKLLEREKYKVVFPSEQTCCGQPAYNSGYREQAQMVATKQVDLFLEDYPILVPSGSCAAMMKHHYQDLLSSRNPKSLASFMSRVEEWSSFYHRIDPDLEDQGAKIKIAWHGSCHSLREMKVEGEPLDILGKLANVEVIPLIHQRECCGFGGMFSVKFPKVSTAIADRKLDEIIQSDVDAVVSSDLSCLTHMRTRLEKISQSRSAVAIKPIAFYHLADFIMERIGLS